MRFDRRTFLKAAGLAGLSTLVPTLGRGQGDRGGRPRRIIFVMTELGWNPFEVRMAPPGAPPEVLLRSAYHPAYEDQPDELRWELDLTRTPQEEWSPTLAPLYPVRDKTIVLDGLGMLSIGADQYGDAHAKGWVHALSGHPSSAYITGQRAMGGAPSIDRRLARHFAETDPNLTDLSTLLIDVSPWWGGGGTGGFHHWFHDVSPTGDGFERVPTIGDPRVLHDRLFGASRSSARARILAELNDRYAATYPHLGRDGRDRLDQHRQRISEIQSRIATLGETACEAPPLGERPSGGDSAAFLSNLDLFLDMTVAAMTCDITRMVSLNLGNPGGVQRDLYGAADFDFHEWYSHGTNPPKRWIGVEGADVAQADHDKWLDAAPVIAAKNRFHVQQVAELAQRLDATPDGEGTLLDSTLIVLMDEISHGSHGHDQWPVVLVGGFGGEFRTGRYVRFPRNNPDPGINSMGAWVGQPHNQLLVSILQGMGMEIDHLGIDAVYARGGRESGRRISLTGRMHELY